MRRFLVAMVAGCLGWSGPLAGDEAMAPEVTVSARDCHETAPAVAYDSNRDHYMVVWYEVCTLPSTSRRVLARRLQADGRPVDGFVLILEPPGADAHDRAEPALAYDPDGDRYLVVYSYDYWGDGSDWDLRGFFLAGALDAAQSDEITFAASGLDERAATVAFSTISDKYLVSWQRDDPVNGTGVWGATFAFGAAPVAFALATTPQRGSPALSYDPFADRFLAAYDSVTSIFAALVDPAGGVGSETTLAATEELEFYAAAASCANWQHVVIWQATDTPGGDYDVLARFLYGNGAFDGSAFGLPGFGGDERNVDVACRSGDIDYLIVYETEWNQVNFGIAGQRIRATKVARPYFDVRAPAVGDAGLTSNPAVAGGRAGWFVAWAHQRQGSSWTDIHGRVVWELFADGFEWGSTGGWSATGP